MYKILIVLAGLLFLGAKKKTLVNVQVDFSQMDTTITYQISFTDSLGNSTLISSANGVNQSIALSSGTYTISFYGTVIPGVVTVLPLDDVGTICQLNGSKSAPLNAFYSPEYHTR